MTPKTEVRAREALHDIRAGLDDFELMEKYRLTDKGLQSLFRKLIAAGLLSPLEIDDRQSPLVSTITLDLS